MSKIITIAGTTNKRIYLSKKEIKEQEGFAKKYLDLINKEVALGAMLDVKRLALFAGGYKYFCEIIQNGYIKNDRFKE